jgi:transcriptional antiterminator NusG
MAYFALQCRSREEERFTAAWCRAGDPSVLLWPRRSLRVRRRGRWTDAVAPIFPGYLFVRAEEIDVPLFRALRALPGFVRFLPSSERIRALDQRDSDLLSHFLSFGEIVQRSVVSFDPNQRIRVLAGPLLGLEGCITRVDRRKGRARVRLALYQDSFEVDFGFDSIEAAGAPAAR